MPHRAAAPAARDDPRQARAGFTPSPSAKGLDDHQQARARREYGGGIPLDNRESAMRIADLCRRDVVTASPSTSLVELARLMRKSHVGSVLIVAEPGKRKLAGIVTDRDIVIEVLAMGLNPFAVTAGDIMTASPAVARPGDDALWALKIMRDRGVRRLPVVDEGGELLGLLAFDDLMQHVASLLGDISQVIGTERVVESWRRA